MPIAATSKQTWQQQLANPKKNIMLGCRLGSAGLRRRCRKHGFVAWQGIAVQRAGWWTELAAPCHHHSSSMRKRTKGSIPLPYLVRQLARESPPPFQAGACSRHARSSTSRIQGAACAALLQRSTRMEEDEMPLPAHHGALVMMVRVLLCNPFWRHAKNPNATTCSSRTKTQPSLKLRAHEALQRQHAAACCSCMPATCWLRAGFAPRRFLSRHQTPLDVHAHDCIPAVGLPSQKMQCTKETSDWCTQGILRSSPNMHIGPLTRSTS